MLLNIILLISFIIILLYNFKIVEGSGVDTHTPITEPVNVTTSEVVPEPITDPSETGSEAAPLTATSNNTSIPFTRLIDSMFKETLVFLNLKGEDTDGDLSYFDFLNSKGIYKDDFGPEKEKELEEQSLAVNCKDDNVKINNLSNYDDIFNDQMLQAQNDLQNRYQNPFSAPKLKLSKGDQNAALVTIRRMDLDLNSSYISMIQHYDNDINDNDINDNDIFGKSLNLGPFEFNFHHGNPELNEDKKAGSEYKLCDLAPILYDNDTSDDGKKMIYSHMGNCFRESFRKQNKIHDHCSKSCNDIINNKDKDKYIYDCRGIYQDMQSVNSDVDISCSRIYDNVLSAREKFDSFYYYDKNKGQYFSCMPGDNTELIKRINNIALDPDPNLKFEDIIPPFKHTTRICKLPKCNGEKTDTPTSTMLDMTCSQEHYYDSTQGYYYHYEENRVTDKCDTKNKIRCMPNENYPKC